MAHGFDVVMVDRAMAQVGAPTFTEIGPLIGASSVKLTEKLNAPERLELSIPATHQPLEVAQRFTTPTDPFEFRLTDDTGDRLFAGPLLGFKPEVRDGSLFLSITAEGIPGYLRRMLAPEPDGVSLQFSGVDQANIAKALIDYWQDLDYGHYGIDTSGVATTGVLRDRTYAVPELHIVSQRIAELGAVSGGFDTSIDSTTRAFSVHYPRKGTDLTQAVIFDMRSMMSLDSQISVGPEDIISDAYAVSDTGLVSHQFDPGLRASFGRTGLPGSFQGISVQATLDAYAQRMLDQRDSHLHMLGGGFYPIGLDWGDFETGDTVEAVFDFSSGQVHTHTSDLWYLTEQRRITERQLVISESGPRVIGVKFE